MINPKDLSWTGSNERADNSPYLPEDRLGYNVYVVSAGDAPVKGGSIFTAIATDYNFTMPISDLGAPLAEGDYEMFITDMDTDNRESDFSVALAFSIVVAIPKPPTGLSAS